jgi:hypothetical protein
MIKYRLEFICATCSKEIVTEGTTLPYPERILPVHLPAGWELGRRELCNLFCSECKIKEHESISRRRAYTG